MTKRPPIPSDRTDAVLLVDWMELTCLFGGQINVRELCSGSEIVSDEADDTLVSDPEVDDFTVRIDTEVRRRIDALGTSVYPFEFSGDGLLSILSGWETEAGRTAYLFCLIVTHCEAQGLLRNGFPLGPSPAELGQARELFQVCATVALAGTADGPSYWMGSPRPGKENFHKKASRVYREFGDGVVRSKKLPVTKFRKDAGIDVLAWKRRADRGLGTYYVLGQAASGANVLSKSFVPDVEAFHQDWFEQRPVSICTPITVVPHYVGEEEARRWRHHLGELRGRAIVPRDADVGMRVAQRGEVVEGAGRVGEIADWVKAIQTRVQVAA